MAAGDRIEIRVAADGSGQFSKVQDAINAVPKGNLARTVITLAPGVYRETVFIGKQQDFITLAGEVPEATVISWNNTFQNIVHHEPEEVRGKGTFGCGSVIIEGDDFIAENITFENDAPEGSHQAVALRISGDRGTFLNCRFLGWQDTLYLHHGKQYLRDCYIEGSVDYIFGNATALFEHCHLHCKADGFITAHGRNTAEESTGFVFLRCVITGKGGEPYAYLGRPWKPHSRVVFAYCHIDPCIQPEGWSEWDNSENHTTSCFYEYKCSGLGCGLDNRVGWSKQLQEDETKLFLSHSFIDPDEAKPWLQQLLALRVPLSA